MRDVTIRVEAGQAGKAISPSLFGIFYEDLNHSGEGGLHAELVKNRCFNSPELLEGWQVVVAPGSEATMGPAHTPGVNPVNPWGLRLQALSTDGGPVGVSNAGYWGMAVRGGASYRLTLDAWAVGVPRVRAELVVGAGEVLASAAVDGLAATRSRLTAVLTPSRDAADARLVLWMDQPGTLWLDMVSLLPVETWRGLPFRVDLAELMAELRPSFVRFPGGCYVEGDFMREAFRWKTSLGDMATRSGHWNRWGYWTTTGIGYHEYLLMCEALGAAPLFVVNAGLAHGDAVTQEQLQEYIQDALDAIEYANGPVESTWGAKRAAAGHPQPFGLEMMEIGNEHGGAKYFENFRRFHAAIKAKYPYVKVVSTCAIPEGSPDIVDEHFFSPFKDYVSQLTSRYDTYDRSGPRIYVGEYACPPAGGLGNLKGALAEAAFMTALERNGDMVTMASFAPLFTHAYDRHWEYDAIVFDNTRICRTPSYHVQKLFSLNRCSHVFRCTVDGAAPAHDVADAAGVLAVAGKRDGEIILKLVNVTDQPHAARLQLDGLADGKRRCHETVLTADSPETINTLLQPDRIRPATRQYEVDAGERITLQPWSLTIIRFPMA